MTEDKNAGTRDYSSSRQYSMRWKALSIYLRNSGSGFLVQRCSFKGGFYIIMKLLLKREIVGLVYIFLFFLEYKQLYVGESVLPLLRTTSIFSNGVLPRKQ